MMEETILLIAQVSSALTSLAGILSLIYLVYAIKKILPGEFRNALFLSLVFLIAAVIGISSMAIYHFTENHFVYGNMHVITDNVWYSFMFLALAFSLFESWKLHKLGKSIALPARFRKGKK